VHDHCYPFGAKAHVKLHAIAQRCACNEGDEAVLTDRLVVSPTMSEEERALE
jgi:hypothetical protein